jgi:hypothetical protein
MKLGLRSSATIVERVITFVRSHRIQPWGLTEKNKKVTIEEDDTRVQLQTEV